MCSWTFIAARRDRMQLSLYKKRESLCISCVVPRVAGENVPILTKRSARIPSLIRANSSRSGMSREMLSYVSILFCAVLIVNTECASGIPDRCLDLAKFDVNEIENHLSKLNLTDVPTVNMMTAGFKCPISALPFGTLKSDWARLLLLREAQPNGSIIKLKLVRLMRILIIAYYQMEERIDVTDSEAKIAKKSMIEETMTTVAEDKSQSHCPNNNSSKAEISSNNVINHCPCTFLNAMRLVTKKDSRIKSNATMKNLSSPNGTITFAPSDATRRTRNVTSSSDLDTTITYHQDDAKKAAMRILGNCLKQSLKNVTRRQPSNKIFEIVKNKAKSIEDNEIGDRKRDRIIRISPPINEFWRYVTFPTKSPLTIASVAPAYRMRELNGFRTGRKSRKRVKLNNDIYESFRQFYGANKNA
ncbi:PREDICTED: uncharacterized protein LOC105147691 [Acromyrmex echinatior]|uniref:uncharacterized protein LOC105147691 n=1 Tax=Acromyrmex echinatior TaxID=103372 RepID=UPI000580FF67|nr:PREDICTED: uncharacterized protein LOC105147691 [Acromyrmex echinatior]